MKRKVLISSVPYVYFIGWASYWFVMDIAAAGSFNFIALAILLALVAQVIVRNNAIDLILGALSMIISVYMFVAVLSEFNNFSSVNDNARQLVLAGTLISVSGFAIAMLIFRSHFKSIGFNISKQ